MDLPTAFRRYAKILTECAISERLRRTEGIVLHPTLFNTPLMYDTNGREAMAAIYRQYRDIAARARLPILLCAPTWRLDRERLAQAGYDQRLLHDAVSFLRDLQQEHPDPRSPVYIGGLIGPRNDCYRPDQALAAEEAAAFHTWQIGQLVQAGVDCIVAQTIPAVSEALGIADALAHGGVPAIISFVINRRARVLDGTPLPQAISRIDGSGAPPLGYMVNCVYPTFLQAEQQEARLFQRLIGIQANSSSLDHSELDGSALLHQDDLHHWGDNMLRLNRQYGVRLLGGCCGTDDRHLRYLAQTVDQ